MHSTHDQCREAWKTAEKLWCDGKRLLQVQLGRLSLVRVWGLVLGQAHSVVMARPSGRL